MSAIDRITSSRAPSAVILIRLMVGAVFLSEGIQKFINPSEVGSGRFAKIGLPSPEISAPLVGAFEIACGVLLLIGLLTRLAAVPLIVIMLTAISTTKIPILLSEGFRQMAHDSRTDWSMLLGSLFLFIVGAGRWSLDSYISSQVSQADIGSVED